MPSITADKTMVHGHIEMFDPSADEWAPFSYFYLTLGFTRTFRAVPAPGMEFDHWVLKRAFNPDIVSANNPYAIETNILNMNFLTLLAVFKRAPHKGIDIARTVIRRNVGNMTHEIDLTERLAVQPVVKHTVNMGFTASFTISNDILSETDNLMLDTCAMWSNGLNDKIRSTDRVIVTYANDELGINQRLFSGIIATITPYQDTIEIDACDVVEELKKVGTQYFRNHYNHGGSQSGELPVGWDGNTNSVHIYRAPAGDANLLPGTIMFAKNTTHDQKATNSVNNIGVNPETYMDVEYDVLDLDFVYSIEITTFALIRTGATIKISSTATHNGDLHESTIDIWPGSIVRTFPLNTVAKTKKIFIRMSVPRGFAAVTIVSNNSQYGIVRNYNGSILTNTAPVMTIRGATYMNAVGNPGVVNNSYVFVISQLTDGTTLDESDLLPNFSRGYAGWLSPGVDMGAVDIVSDILDANDYRLIGRNANPSIIGINLFRCGGDHIHNYLLTIADMPNEAGPRDGYQNVIAGDLLSDDGVFFSKRMKVDDPPRFDLVFAGQDPNMDKIWMKSINVEQTIAKKPVTTMIQGTDDNGLPIMLALTDIGRMNRSGGIMLSSANLDNNVSSVIDAAKVAYAEIIQHGGSPWSGSIELSGVHNGFTGQYKGFIDIDSANPHDTYGSGVPIAITDKRKGMDNEPALVSEVTYDFRDLTTKIQITSYSVQTSNAITDSIGASRDAGIMALDANNESLQVRQFLYLRTDGATIPHGATVNVRIKLTGNVVITKQAVVMPIPNLGSTLLYTHFHADPFNEINHAVEEVAYQIGSGQFVNIPYKISQRVDKGPGQSLIINIQIKHP